MEHKKEMKYCHWALTIILLSIFVFPCHTQTYTLNEQWVPCGNSCKNQAIPRVYDLYKSKIKFNI